MKARLEFVQERTGGKGLKTVKLWCNVELAEWEAVESVKRFSLW